MLNTDVRTPSTLLAGLAASALLFAACTPASAPSSTSAPVQKAPSPPAAASPKPAGASPAVSPSPSGSPAAKTTVQSPPPSYNREEIARAMAGKTITLTVGYAPGGGFDTIARIFAEIAPRHIPGNPSMVVANLPGGDSLVAAQKVMAQRPDGLNWVLVVNGLLQRDILGDLEGFDATKALYLGTPDNAPTETFLMVRSSAATSIQAVMASRTSLQLAEARGGSGAEAEFAKLVGIPVEPVYGYSGTAEYYAALNRGEVHGTFRGDPGVVRRLFPDWVPAKTITPVLFFDKPCCQKFIEEGGWAMPPVLTDVVKLTETQRRAYDVHNSLRATRIFALPGGIPDNLRIGLQAAFADTLQDPEFIQAFTERVGTQVGLGTGEDILRGVQMMKEQPPEVLEILKKMYAID